MEPGIGMIGENNTHMDGSQIEKGIKKRAKRGNESG